MLLRSVSSPRNCKLTALVWGLLCIALPLELAAGAQLDYKVPPVDNPLKGLVPYSGSSNDKRFPHSLEFAYFALREVLTGQTTGSDVYTFDWSNVETFLENARARGHQGVFRIYSEYPSVGLSIPQFLVNQGVVVTQLQYGNETSWTPDYGDARFVKALTGTIAALGAKYDGDPRVGFIELGLLGLWGEWHNFGQDSYAANGATRAAVLQSYENAFSTTKLLTRYPVGASAGEKANYNRRVGYHDDSFTWSTIGTPPWYFCNLLTYAGALDKWKTQAIGGESLNGNVFVDPPPLNEPADSNFLQNVQATHATYMRVETVFDNVLAETRIDRAKAAVRGMGYDLYFSQATITPVGNGFTVNAMLTNRGVAPFYYNWTVTVGLIDATGATIQEWPVSWRIDSLVRNEQRTFNETFTPATAPPAGAQVVLRVANPMAGGRPLRFSNLTQQPDGKAWMILGGANGQAPVAAKKKVLFIRGGEGTVGFLEGGSDEQGADAFNYSTNGGNHNWGELNSALVAEGFKVEQLAENPVVAGVPTAIPIDAMDLYQYAIIVFGSNNAKYTVAQVDAFMHYIELGGSALFVSDANFGQNWGDAPSSDQYFLGRFGLTMNQGGGTYGVRSASEFVNPGHPILNGVNEFDGAGVSPITLGTPPAGVTSNLISSARFNVTRNTGAGQGLAEPAAANDASLVVATFGSGRIAGHFNRNTFFNENGAGTNINRLDNETYARNLFNWLAGNPIVTGNKAPRGYFPTLIPGSSMPEGVAFATSVVAKDPDGSVVSVVLKIDGVAIATDTAAPYDFAVSGLTGGNRTITATVTDNLGKTTDVDIPIEVIGGGNVEQPLDRRRWILTATNNAGDLGNAIDGDIASHWTTEQLQRPGQKVSIDFGKRNLFQRVLLETRYLDDYPRAYIVRASDNGISFTQIAIGIGVGATTNISLPAPVTYRYLEIEQTGTSVWNWWSINEINVFQPPANGTLPLSSWLQFHYGKLLPGLLQDSDGDGLTTLEKYAYNANPLVSNTSSAPTSRFGIDPLDQAHFIDYTFRRWKDSSLSNVNYILESSGELASWKTSGLNLLFMPNPIQHGDGTETVTARIKFSSTEGRNFVRLHLVPK